MASPNLILSTSFIYPPEQPQRASAPDTSRIFKIDVVVRIIFSYLICKDLLAMGGTCVTLRESMQDYLLIQRDSLTDLCTRLGTTPSADILGTTPSADILGTILSYGIPRHLAANPPKTCIRQLNAKILREHLLSINTDPNRWISLNLSEICQKLSIKQELSEDLATFIQRSLQKLGCDGHLIKEITHLKIGSLCNSTTNLEAFLNRPSFEKMSVLTHLELSRCISLRQLPAAIGSLKALTHLDLRRCRCLTSLPESIGDLTALTRLKPSRVHKP